MGFDSPHPRKKRNFQNKSTDCKGILKRHACLIDWNNHLQKWLRLDYWLMKIYSLHTELIIFRQNISFIILIRSKLHGVQKLLGGLFTKLIIIIFGTTT